MLSLSGQVSVTGFAAIKNLNHWWRVLQGCRCTRQSKMHMSFHPHYSPKNEYILMFQGYTSILYFTIIRHVMSYVRGTCGKKEKCGKSVTKMHECSWWINHCRQPFIISTLFFYGPFPLLLAISFFAENPAMFCGSIKKICIHCMQRLKTHVLRHVSGCAVLSHLLCSCNLLVHYSHIQPRCLIFDGPYWLVPQIGKGIHLVFVCQLCH